MAILDPEYTGNGSAGNSNQTQATSDIFDDTRAAAKERVRSEAERQRGTAARAMSDSAKALEKAAESLDESGQPSLSRTTSSLASGLSSVAQRLEQSDTDELVQEVSRFARQNPTLFILGGVGAGLLLSRFLKASASHSNQSH